MERRSRYERSSTYETRHTNKTIQSVAISQCGTFALVGSAGGNIDVFNMQSGLHRQSFPSKLSKSRNLKSKISTASREGEWKHTKEVTGLMINALNQTVVSCGLDGKVKVSHLVYVSFHFSG